MKNWLLHLTHWILQGLLCAAVILQIGNSHILELLIKSSLKNSASNEENIYEMYFILLKSQTHPLHSWKKFFRLRHIIAKCIFKSHVVNEKCGCNTVFQCFWMPFLIYTVKEERKYVQVNSTQFFFCVWVMLSQWTIDMNKNLRTKLWDGD